MGVTCSIAAAVSHSFTPINTKSATSIDDGLFECKSD
jgi:hypothetical protein